MDHRNFVFNFVSDYEAIIHNIARGLRLMHDSGLVHCDLHPGNILIRGIRSFVERGDETFKECIGDFGLSRPANIEPSIKSSGIYGVVPYIAPELLRG